MRTMLVVLVGVVVGLGCGSSSPAASSNDCQTAAGRGKVAGMLPWTAATPDASTCLMTPLSLEVVINADGTAVVQGAGELGSCTVFDCTGAGESLLSVRCSGGAIVDVLVGPAQGVPTETDALKCAELPNGCSYGNCL